MITVKKAWELIFQTKQEKLQSTLIVADSDFTTCRLSICIAETH